VLLERFDATVLADCGHVPQLERTAETHAAIVDALLEGSGQ
jgi:pimeloyl-ACP methyl ester carboxylesterase